MQRLATLLPIGPRDELAHRGARRRTARYPIHADVRLLGPTPAEGIALNASAGGLRVALDRAVSAGQIVTLELATSLENVSRETAEVVWSRELPDGWLAGLRFVAA